jgi:molybdopterin/thiamine biosynthesis adenylyltransferase
MRFNDISIVGLGGIGSILSNTISRFISNDARENDPRQIINLIDGDYYEEKNLVRQEFLRFGNKAESKLNELRPKFNNIEFKDYPYFIDDITISRIIKDKDLVFLAVDNHKTRKLVSDYAKKLNDIIIISGGNELEDGNVQLYIRKDGEDVTPSLTDYHPEIRNPIDKLPNEMSCEELQNSEPQLYFTNLGVATFMAFAFYNVLKGSNNFSEVYFDMNTMKADSKTRNLKKEKGE